MKEMKDTRIKATHIEGETPRIWKKIVKEIHYGIKNARHGSPGKLFILRQPHAWL